MSDLTVGGSGPHKATISIRQLGCRGDCTIVLDFSAHCIDGKEQELPVIFGIPGNCHVSLNSRAEEEAVENVECCDLAASF